MFEVIMPLYFHKFDATLAERLFAHTIFSAFAGASNEVSIPTYNVIPQLGQIQTPTLILAGRDDFICPLSQAEIMHQGIPHSEIVIFEHSGHLPHVEESETFVSTVRSWFTRIAR